MKPLFIFSIWSLLLESAMLVWSVVKPLPLAGHEEAICMLLLSYSASSFSIAAVLIGDHIGLEKPARFSDSQGALCAEVTETTCSGQVFILNTLELVQKVKGSRIILLL